MSELAHVLNAVADIFILIAFSAMLIFTASYVVFFRWRKTKAGRAILYVFAALLAVTAPSLMGRWIGPDYWMREWFRVICWGLTVIAVLNLIRVLWYNFIVGGKPLSLEPRTQPNDVIE